MNKNARRAYTGYAILAALVALLLRIGSKVPNPGESNTSDPGDTSDPTGDPGPMPGPQGDPTDLPTLDPTPTPEPAPAPVEDPALDPDPAPSPAPDPDPYPGDIDWSGRDSGTAAEPESVDLPMIGTAPSPNPDTYDEQDVENAVIASLIATGAIASAGSGVLAGSGVRIGSQALASGSLTLPSSVTDDVDASELDAEIRRRLNLDVEQDTTDVDTSSGIDWSSRDSGTASDPGSDDSDDEPTYAWDSGGYDSGTAADTDTSDPGSDDSDDEPTYAWDSGGYDSGTAADPGSSDDDDDGGIFS